MRCYWQSYAEAHANYKTHANCSSICFCSLIIGFDSLFRTSTPPLKFLPGFILFTRTVLRTKGGGGGGMGSPIGFCNDWKRGFTRSKSVAEANLRWTETKLLHIKVDVLGVNYHATEKDWKVHLNAEYPIENNPMLAIGCQCLQNPRMNLHYCSNN